jgi:Glycosyl transferases group 1
VQGLRAEIEAGSELHDGLWGDFAGDRPYFGVYGKLGDKKGTFALLSALHRLKLDAKADVGLVALAHGRPPIEARFRAQVQELGLTNRVLQVPFLPHWRVPEFLRSCLAVCCLEQDFPIGFHSPITPLEVLLCGACLVGSTEVIRKLPQWERLPHGYGCVAIKDVNDTADLSKKLAAMVADPGLAAPLRVRGRKFARDAQQTVDFPQWLELILKRAARRERPTTSDPGAASGPRNKIGRFPLARMAMEALGTVGQRPCAVSAAGTLDEELDLGGAQRLLVEIKRAVGDERIKQVSLVQAVEAEIAIESAENDESWLRDNACPDPLFRLHSSRWAIGQLDFGALVPVRDCPFRIVRFEYDVSEFRGATAIAELPREAGSHPSHVVVFHREENREPLIVDAMTARFLELVDGRKTVAEIIAQLDQCDDVSTLCKWARWVEHLFLLGVIGLRDVDFNG